MIRSMSTALSGLRNHQVMLDVVGNDIANVSTVGFKSSTTVFSDVLTQTIQGAAAPVAGLQGGTNAAQIGLGSRLMATVQSFTQGALQRTGRATDLAIQGDGFFQVQTASETMFTRGGALTLDAAGNLTTAEGFFVQGWQADVTGAINTNAATGSLQVRVGDLLNPNQSQNATIGGNLSADAPIGTATTNTLTGYDEQGATTPINLTYTKTAANTWTVTGTYGPGATAFAITDNVLTFSAGGELVGPADRNMNVAGGVIPGYPNPIVFGRGQPGPPHPVRRRDDGGDRPAGRRRVGHTPGVQRRPGRRHHRELLQRSHQGHRPARVGGVQQPAGPRARGRRLASHGELRARPGGRPRWWRPRPAVGRHPRDVERRPRRGVHPPDRRPARLPG
jgi:flagellar hook-basal body protein